MAIATAAAIAAIATAGVQTTSGLIGAAKDRKAIENFKPQELVNPYDNIQLSTLKSEQQTDAANVNFANSVDALQRTGTRGVLGGIPSINNSNILLQNMISADLEKQDKERSILIAQGDERIAQIRENREQGALQGLGQSLQTNRQDAMNGVSNLVSSGLSLGSAMSFDKANPDMQLFGKK